MKITFAGENTCKIKIRTQIVEKWLLEIYETNTITKSGGKCIKDVHGRVQPLCEFLICTPLVVKFVDLVLKHGQNVGGRVTLF